MAIVQKIRWFFHEHLGILPVFDKISGQYIPGMGVEVGVHVCI